MVLGIFKIAVRLRDQQVFFGQSVEISNILYFNIFSKSWTTVFLVLVESTSIENTTSPYRTVLSGANAETIKMGSTKWIYRKEHSLSSSYFIFLKILFQFKNLLQRSDLMYQLPKCPNRYFL